MPLLTLTSDIGWKDYLVGAIKGQILQVNDGFQLIDISHQLTPFNYPQTAYVCRNAFKSFPEETFHMVLVNLFDTRPEHLLLAKHQNQYIAIADNGLLTMILEGQPEKVVALPLEKTQQKTTVYFAQVFAQAFTDLLSGVAMEKIGNPDIVIQTKNHLRPMLSNGWIEGQIIFIDHFENVVVNITREEFETQRRGRSFKIVFKRDEVIDKIGESYADAGEGEKVAVFNAAGYLEIAVNKGNAAGLFGLHGYSDKQVSAQSQFLQSRLFYQTVKIFFE
jgi:S-adenosyl-L-methionine hydrolase (adenosine-forming)